MSIYDGLLLLILVFFVFLGFQRGFIKQVSDFVVLLISMIIAAPLSKLICNLTYKVLPFFNFMGDAKGLKTLNLILWRLIIYFLIILIIIFIVSRIFAKFKISNKIRESMVEQNIVSKILGAIMSVFLGVIVLYNALMIINTPFIEFNLNKESKVSKFIMEKTLVISSLNKDVYKTSNYAKKIVHSKKNTDKNYKNVNIMIINNMIVNDLVSSDLAIELNDDGKLQGKRKTVIDEIEEETGVTNPTEYNTTHNLTTTEYRDY